MKSFRSPFLGVRFVKASGAAGRPVCISICRKGHEAVMRQCRAYCSMPRVPIAALCGPQCRREGKH